MVKLNPERTTYPDDSVEATAELFQPARRRHHGLSVSRSARPRHSSRSRLRSSKGLWCKRQDLARYDVGRAAGGVGMSKLMGLEQLFEGRHFDREVIILCVRWDRVPPTGSWSATLRHCALAASALS